MGRPPADTSRPPTPERVLAAAERAFARDGYAAPLASIAREAGIRRPSLLYHFESKERLYEAVVRSAFARLGAALAAALVAPADDFAARLDAVLGAYLSFLEERPSFARLVLREVLDDRGPGRALLIEGGAPLLDRVEAFVQEEGGGRLAPDFPRRAALMQLAVDPLVRAAAGRELTEPLWGAAEPTLALARALFLTEETS